MFPILLLFAAKWKAFLFAEQCCTNNSRFDQPIGLKLIL